jgi:predicted hydrocarbon binding protein
VVTLFDFFKKLLMARQITFEEGQIKVAGETAIMTDGPALIKLTDIIVKKMGKRGITDIYLASKEGGESLGISFKKKFNLTGTKLADLLKDLAVMGGWGKMEFIRYDPESMTVIGKVVDSPFAELTEFKNKKMCHITRGFVAGALSIVFKTDVDCIETKCKAEGSNFCELLIKPKGKFKEKKLVKEQLP